MSMPPLPLFLIFVVRYIKLTLVFVPYDFHIIYNPTRFFTCAPPPPLRNSNASKLNGSLAVFYFTFFIALLMITCQINIHSPLYAHNMEAGILLSMRWRVHLTTVTTRRDTVKKLIYFTWRNIKWVSLYLIKTWLNFMSNYLGQNNSNSEYKCMTDVE